MIDNYKVHAIILTRQNSKGLKNKNKNLRAVLTRGIGKMFIKEIEFDRDFFKILHKYKSLYL